MIINQIKQRDKIIKNNEKIIKIIIEKELL